MDSILISIKKLLGIEENYTHFDTDIIMHINSVLSILTQLCVGPSNGYSIKDANAVWDEFISDSKKLELVDYKKSVDKFFVRVSSEDKAAVEKVFGNVSYVPAEGVTGELGFVTETMTEAEFESKAAELGNVVQTIRVA